jgi:hypothetical protein
MSLNQMNKELSATPMSHYRIVSQLGAGGLGSCVQIVRLPLGIEAFATAMPPRCEAAASPRRLCCHHHLGYAPGSGFAPSRNEVAWGIDFG